MQLEREMKKINKYSNEQLLGGASLNFIPLVHEHFGHWGQAAKQFLDSLAKWSRDIEGNPNMAEFKNIWRRCLSVTIQKCHANVILRKISRLCEGIIIQDDQFDRDINSFIHKLTNGF